MNILRPKVFYLALTYLSIAVTTSRCQEIFIDALGPNNAFKASEGLFGLSATLGSTPSIGFDHYFPLNQNSRFVYPKLWGVNVKATADNGWSALDEQAPQFNFDALINWSAVDTKSGTWTITLRGDGEYDNADNIYDKTRMSGSQVYSRDWTGGAGTVYFGWAPGTHWAGKYFDPRSLAFRIGLGYEFTNSYASLKSVDLGKTLTAIGNQTVVGSAKSYRSGVFNDYNAYPVSFLMAFNASTASPNMDSWVRKVFNPTVKNYEGEFIFSPYFSLTPSDYRSPTDLVGLNIVTEWLNHKSPKKIYTVGVFIERDNTFRGSPSMTAGSALTFHF